MYKLFTFILFSTLSFVAPSSVPLVTKEPGKRLTITWPSEGKIAEVQRFIGPFEKIPINFELLENECFASFEQDEVYFSPFYRLDYIAAVWVKNPANPERVGKILEKSFGGPFIKMKIPIEATPVNKKVFPSLFNNMPKPELTLPFIDLQSFNIVAWLSEQMIRNPETGIDENMIVSGAYNMKISKSSEESFTVTNEGIQFNQYKNSAWPLLGDVISWNLDLNGQNCLIAFLPKLDDLDQKIKRYKKEFIFNSSDFTWGNNISNYIEKTNRNFLEFGQTIPVLIR